MKTSGRSFVVLRVAALVLVAVALGVGGFLWVRPAAVAPSLVASASEDVRRLRPVVLETVEREPTSFTQGLLLHDGRLYESTGLSRLGGGREAFRYEGRLDGGTWTFDMPSALQRVDPGTGEVVERVELEREFFGEGLALVGDRLIQLTWQEETAFVYDVATLERVGRLSYGGEGWGLCFDGEALWMSDGSEVLRRRDPGTLDVLSEVRVTLGGQPVTNLNELACVGDHVYANVFLTDFIVRVDVRSGRVDAVVDASGLLSDAERRGMQPGAVLNGVAHDPEDGSFWVTGKLWPRLFRVRFE